MITRYETALINHGRYLEHGPFEDTTLNVTEQMITDERKRLLMCKGNRHAILGYRQLLDGQYLKTRERYSNKSSHYLPWIVALISVLSVCLVIVILITIAIISHPKKPTNM